MDILTLELNDVTVSEALRELQRVLEAHPGLPLRILLDGDSMLHHNILRFLERKERPSQLRQEGARWRIDVEGLPLPRESAPSPQRPVPAMPRLARPAQPLPAAPPPAREARPLLLTRSHLGPVPTAAGRRLLLGALQELDAATPWLCLALEALDLLEDPAALRILEALQARGVPVRISQESLLFPALQGPFEVMADSHWQRLAGRDGLAIL